MHVWWCCKLAAHITWQPDFFDRMALVPYWIAQILLSQQGGLWRPWPRRLRHPSALTWVAQACPHEWCFPYESWHSSKRCVHAWMGACTGFSCVTFLTKDANFQAFMHAHMLRLKGPPEKTPFPTVSQTCNPYQVLPQFLLTLGKKIDSASLIKASFWNLSDMTYIQRKDNISRV